MKRKFLKSVFSEDTDAVRQMLRADKCLANAGDNEYHAVHYAVINHDMETLELLLKHDCEVDAKCFLGSTALHLAAERGCTPMCITLLKYGANPNAKDENGRTPLHMAVMNKYTDTFLALLQEGADVNVKDNNGNAPIDCATME